MASITFVNRKEFLDSNVQIESINHPNAYTIFINQIPITFEAEDNVYISILDLDDNCYLTNLVSGREACRLLRQFIQYIKTTEERVYVSSTKTLFG